MNSELYRKQYDFEIDQRAHLASSTNIPITAATFLFGGASALAMTFTYDRTYLSITFSVLIILALLSLGVSIYYIFRSLLGYVYQKLPPLAQLDEHHQALLCWHENAGSTPETADKDFEAYLRERLAEAADANSINNTIRGNFLYRATAAIAVSVVLNSEIRPQQVEIIGEIRVAPGDASDEQEWRYE